MGGAVCGINIRGEEEVSPAPVKTAEEGFRMLTPPLFSEDQQRQTLSPDISTATPSLCEEGVQLLLGGKINCPRLKQKNEDVLLQKDAPEPLWSSLNKRRFDFQDFPLRLQKHFAEKRKKERKVKNLISR